MAEQTPSFSQKRWRSIRTRLTTVFALFLALVVLLGLSALEELGAVDRVSAEIRDHWLQDTRLLGDLNNYTSDARAAEASRLLAVTPEQRNAVDRQAQALQVSITQADRNYRSKPHDIEELVLYDRFSQDWRVYSGMAQAVIALARQGRLRQATSLYVSRSQMAYNAASDTLGVLTSRTVAKAAAVNGRALTTYDVARALILAAMAMAAAVLLAAVHYITTRITRPILTLAASMRSIAANDMSVVVAGARRKDEIGEMARAVEVFQANAVELRESQYGLIHQAAMLEEKLQAEEALSAMHRNIVTMTSHEFRTPLSVIDGHAQRMISTAGQANTGQLVERATRIRVVVRQLTQLISHLMNSARLQEGQASLYFHPGSADLSGLVASAIQLHREITPHVQITDLLAPDIIVEADPQLLHQAISNLLSNAIKYSPENRGIEVSTLLDEAFAILSIRDQGIGIPEADLPQIYERFGRASNVGGIVGAGLGLYFVKIVADLHRGSVSVESREGQGSTFTMRIPLARPFS